MKNLSIKKFPIVFVSNYRTGCTEFSYRLSQQLNCAWYSEPVRNPKTKYNFIKHVQSQDDNYIVKFMIDQFEDLPQYKQILNLDCYKIKFLRRNELEQIISYYISKVTETWHQLSENIDNYSVPINIELADKCVKIIVENNRNLEASEINFDTTLYYEDLNYDGVGRQFKTQEPTNINEIRDMITKFYKR